MQSVFHPKIAFESQDLNNAYMYDWNALYLYEIKNLNQVITGLKDADYKHFTINQSINQIQFC